MAHDRRVVPFRPAHYRWLVEKPSFGDLDFAVTDDVLRELEKTGKWFTGVVDGEPIAIAGVLPQWPGRNTVHAILGSDTGPHMLWITREVRKVLDTLKGRVEMTVRCDFDAGRRWAAMLGFDVETPRMLGYGPQGEAHTMYVRFN